MGLGWSFTSSGHRSRPGAPGPSRVISGASRCAKSKDPHVFKPTSGINPTACAGSLALRFAVDRSHSIAVTQQPIDPAEVVYDLTAQSISPGVRSVLILEDDLALAEIVRVFLEHHSYRVTCVASGVEGLRQILAKDFDIILCDLNMPNLPGDMFHLAVERARKHLCQRFIFMTGNASNPIWRRFLSKVSGPILEKPFCLKELVSAIQTLLTERALEDAEKK